MLFDDDVFSAVIPGHDMFLDHTVNQLAWGADNSEDIARDVSFRVDSLLVDCQADSADRPSTSASTLRGD